MTAITGAKVALTPQQLQKYINRVYDAVEDAIAGIRNKDFDIGLVIEWGKIIMLVVEKYPELTGEDKKQIVIAVIKKIVIEIGLDEDNNDIAQTVIDTALPIVIDLVVAASRGDLDLNKIKGRFSKFWASVKKICCCGCRGDNGANSV